MDIDAKYAHAAVRIKAAKRRDTITVEELADERVVDTCVIRRYLKRHPEARKALKVVSHTETLYAAYLSAAACIRARGEAVTTHELGRQLAWRPKRIRMYLTRHCDLARSIGWRAR